MTLTSRQIQKGVCVLGSSFSFGHISCMVCEKYTPAGALASQTIGGTPCTTGMSLAQHRQIVVHHVRLASKRMVHKGTTLNSADWSIDEWSTKGPSYTMLIGP